MGVGAGTKQVITVGEPGHSARGINNCPEVARFIHLEVEKKEIGGKKVSREKMIFPRYHQLDVVRSLVDSGSIGLVTTHDLALTQVAEALEQRARNVHFQDHLEDGVVKFDYLIAL